MRWVERQAKIENDTYETLDDIAEEIGVGVSHLPEVYWIGRSVQREDIGCPRIEEEDFNLVTKCKNSITCPVENIILIGRDDEDHISEEAAHFLHYTSSKIKVGYNVRDKANILGMNSIMEMFGFFGSKLINPDRKQVLKHVPDFIEDHEGFKKEFEGYSLSDPDIVDLVIHQQGYGFGEKLFDAYISDVVPMKNIRRLFLNDFSKKDSALNSFSGLKYDMVNFLNDKRWSPKKAGLS